MIKKLFLIFNFSILLSCGSGSVKTDSMSEVLSLSTKAQITDKISATTNSVNIDIFLKKNTAIRMEVTALLGYEVGSLLMTRSDLQYAVHPDKYFVQGPLVGRTLKPLFKQEIEPQVLWSLIQGESLRSRGFRCQQQKAAHIEICKNVLATVEVEQRGELGPDGASTDGQKKVTIENSRIKFIWIFKSQETLSEYQNETFVLERPKGYKLLTIK
jgi:hypothetical protein